LVALGRAIDHPDAVGGTPQVIAHTLKSGAVEEAGDGDEADDTGVVLGVVIEDLPRGPPPEIDVKVAQVLGVGTDAPIGRRDPSVEERIL
jgi:hypothetical protein